jgi:hypothetical protein
VSEPTELRRVDLLDVIAWQRLARDMRIPLQVAARYLDAGLREAPCALVAMVGGRADVLRPGTLLYGVRYALRRSDEPLGIAMLVRLGPDGGYEKGWHEAIVLAEDWMLACAAKEGL